MIRSVLPFLICLSLSEAYLFNHFSNDFKGVTSKCGFKPYIVNVEGIVGTGKSTFLRFMRVNFYLVSLLLSLKKPHLSRITPALRCCPNPWINGPT